MAMETNPAGLAPASGGGITYRTGVILCLLAGVSWSLTGILIRYTQVADAWQILFYRSLSVVVFLAIILALRGRRGWWRGITRPGWSGIICALMLVLAFAGGIYALQNTTIANAVFLFAVSPLMAALLGRLVLGESVRRATWIAMAIALIGIVLMVSEGISLGRGDGNLAAIIAAFGFAGFTVALRHGKQTDMLPLVCLGGILALIVAAAACYVTGKGLALPARDIALSLTIGVFTLGIGLILFTIGSKVVPAAEIALLSMTEVILAPIWAWMLIGETVAPMVLAGGAVLLLALLGNALSGMRRKPPPLMS